MISAWRAALRMGRRDAWRNKGRSLLVIALIGLPVLILATADITYRTWQLSPSQRITRELGAAQAELQWEGNRLVQTPGAWLGGWTAVGTKTAATNSALPTTRVVTTRLQTGSRVLEELEGASPLQFRTTAGIDQAAIIGLNYADPIARGLIDQLSGRAPQHNGDVAVTSALAAASGLHIGSTVHVVNSTTQLTVVGIVRDTSHRDDQTFYVLPGTVSALEVASAATATTPPAVTPGGPTTWFVDSPRPVTWTDVKTLNQHGFLVLSRQVFLHPPPNSQVDPRALAIASREGGISTQTLTIAALVAGMALIEVILLAGPAFAVGAHRRRRELALMSAVGGQRRDLRNVVLSGGVVLGLAAGVIAVLAGVGLTAFGIPLLAEHVNTLPGTYDLRPDELGLLVLVSVAAAAAAAVFPAHLAARTDVLAALGARRGSSQTPARFPIAGVSVAGLGTVIALVGAAGSHSAVVILIGVGLIELGLIACTPTLLGLAARLSTNMPLPTRLAARDASRNRSAATPAVAAVMASVLGAVAILIALTSSDQRAQHNYIPTLPVATAFTVLVSMSPAGPPASEITSVEQAMQRTLPTNSTVVVHGVDGVATLVHPGQTTTPTGQNVTGSVPLARTIVDDGSGLRTYYGKPEPAAAAALHAGRVVVADPNAVHNGKVSFDLLLFPAGSSSSPASAVPATTQGQPKPRLITLPATAITPTDPATPLIILPPALASRLHIPTAPWGVLVRNAPDPTTQQQQAARGEINSINPDFQLITETGYHNKDAWLPRGVRSMRTWRKRSRPCCVVRWIKEPDHRCARASAYVRRWPERRGPRRIIAMLGS